MRTRGGILKGIKRGMFADAAGAHAEAGFRAEKPLYPCSRSRTRPNLASEIWGQCWTASRVDWWVQGSFSDDARHRRPSSGQSLPGHPTAKQRASPTVGGPAKGHVRGIGPGKADGGVCSAPQPLTRLSRPYLRSAAWSSQSRPCASSSSLPDLNFRRLPTWPVQHHRSLVDSRGHQCHFLLAYSACSMPFDSRHKPIMIV